jgi:hypothetical protein
MNFNRDMIDQIIYNLFQGTAQYKRSNTYAELVQNWEDINPVPTEQEMETEWINIYKELKKDSISVIREERKYAPTIDYAGYTFNTTESFCTLISSEINRCSRKSLTNLEHAWWDSSNVDRLTTLVELEGLEDAITTRVISVMADARTAQVDIDAASTIAAIDTIYDAYVAG